MLSKFHLVALVALLFVATAPRAFAQKHPQPVATASPDAEDEETPQLAPLEGQLEFAARYVKAVNDKDLDGLRKLVAPKALACYTARTMPYLDSFLKRQIQDTVSKPYTITIETRGAADLPKSSLFTLPVPPTHQMNISSRVDDEDVVLAGPSRTRTGGGGRRLPVRPTWGWNTLCGGRRLRKRKPRKSTNSTPSSPILCGRI